MTSPRAKSGLAFASAILAILGFVICPFAPLFALPAVFCGHLALRRIKKDPSQNRGTRLATSGLILGYAGIVTWFALIAVLTKMEQKGHRVRCMNNLKQIGTAVNLWSDDHNGIFPNTLLETSNEICNPVALVCPSDPHHITSLSFKDSCWGMNMLGFSATNITYEFLTPGAARSNVLNVPIVRCPIDGNELYGDGSVHQTQRQK